MDEASILRVWSSGVLHHLRPVKCGYIRTTLARNIDLLDSLRRRYGYNGLLEVVGGYKMQAGTK